MKVEVKIPEIGRDIKEVKIVRWMKKQGEKVKEGETILEIETEKVSFEIQASASGVLSKRLAREGDTLQVGSVVAEISG